MNTTMTFREMNVNVFAGKPIPHVFFQPRLEPWYAWHTTFGALPARYQHQSLLELLDDLHVSMRYTHYYTEMPYPVVQNISPLVHVREHITDDEKTIVYETPYGELVETSRLTVDQTWRVVGFPVKQPTDLQKLRWLIQRITYSFSEEYWEQGSRFIGARGEPQFWLPKSPYQAMALVWMKFEHFIYALADYTAQVEETFKVIDESYDQLYAQIAASRKPKIVNFGENMHEHFLSTKYWERYLIPFYEKRSTPLRRAGVYTHIHIDGYFRSLLKYLKDLPFDGYEALTPRPQGDVSLEQIKEHIGDKVLLDGIPAVMFLPTFSREELMQTTERVVELFHPRLVLGISDEVPEGADAEAIERVRMISQWCQKFGH